MHYLKNDIVKVEDLRRTSMQYSPVTPTTKSPLPASRNFSMVFRPDNTGIWLSKNMIWYLLSSLFVVVDCSKIGPVPVEFPIEGE
jgi:hypothetical protein